MKRTGPTNTELQNIIKMLQEKSIAEGTPLWKRVAKDLEKPTRRRRAVNIARINEHTKDGEIAIVPGKVLALGELDRNITVAAFTFSKQAAEKINKQGKAITLKELLQQNPKPQSMRIIG